MRNLIAFLLDVLVVLDSYPERVVHAIVKRIQHTIGCSVFPILLTEALAETVCLLVVYSMYRAPSFVNTVLLLGAAVFILMTIVSVHTAQIVEQRSNQWAHILLFWNQCVEEEQRSVSFKRFIAAIRLYALLMFMYWLVVGYFGPIRLAFPGTDNTLTLSVLGSGPQPSSLNFLPMLLFVYTLTAKTLGPGDRDRARDLARDTQPQKNS